MQEALECSPEELQRLGDAAALRARERHDIRVSAKRMADLFEHYVPKA